VREVTSRRQPLRDTADPRRAGLRRMRTVATLLRALMTVVFVLSATTKLDWPWLPGSYAGKSLNPGVNLPHQ
jgi:hypothetical protein